jgi:hypothetical protein
MQLGVYNAFLGDLYPVEPHLRGLRAATGPALALLTPSAPVPKTCTSPERQGMQ